MSVVALAAASAAELALELAEDAELDQSLAFEGVSVAELVVVVVVLVFQLELVA